MEMPVGPTARTRSPLVWRIGELGSRILFLFLLAAASLLATWALEFVLTSAPESAISQWSSYVFIWALLGSPLVAVAVFARFSAKQSIPRSLVSAAATLIAVVAVYYAVAAAFRAVYAYAPGPTPTPLDAWPVAGVYSACAVPWIALGSLGAVVYALKAHRSRARTDRVMAAMALVAVVLYVAVLGGAAAVNHVAESRRVPGTHDDTGSWLTRPMVGIISTGPLLSLVAVGCITAVSAVPWPPRRSRATKGSPRASGDTPGLDEPS